MKTTKWLWLLFIACVFTSCEKAVLSGDEERGKEQKITKIISIHPTAIHVDLAEEGAMAGSKPRMSGLLESRAEKAKLYALNIYEKRKGAKSYSKYAYGLFSDPSNIAIRMTEGSLYKIECLMTENGEDTIYNKDHEYLLPFLNGTDKPTKVGNSFIMSTKDNLGHILDGKTNVSAKDITMYPRLIKSYAVIEDFDPKSANDLTLNLKHAAFGLHFKITPPEEGELEIDYLHYTLTVKSTDPSYDKLSVYSFNMISDACKDGYKGDITVKMKWTKADGSIEEASTTVTLKRNVIMVMDISVTGPSPKGINFAEEGHEMSTENITWHVRK